MGRLSEVTEELAMKLLSEVDFKLRFQGTKFHAMSGGVPVIFTELREVKDFLHVGSLNNLLTVGGGGTVNFVDWIKLKAWISDIFTDYELAEAIGKEIEKESSYIKTVGPIRELLEERLEQCKLILDSRVFLSN